jgi:hypothetical protein
MKCLAILFAFAAALFGQEAVESRVSVLGTEVRYWHAAKANEKPAPLVVVLPNAGEAQEIRKLYDQWQQLSAAAGWQAIVPSVSTGSDGGVLALSAIVADAVKKLNADASATFLVGPGASASDVFYAVSRTPYLWAAAIAIQGTPNPAIQTNHLYAANVTNVPLLWVAPPAGAAVARQKLTAIDFPMEVRGDIKPQELFEWLAKHRRADFPSSIDCETGNPRFSKCYWIEMIKFDPSKRNDALRSTRVWPGSGASLNLGGFGFDPAAAGPGVPVSWLPDGYQGPLKLNDRIVSVSGKNLENAADYVQLMEEQKEEKPAAVVVQRGKDRIRLESKIVMPKRDELITARVQAKYTPEIKEVFIISRAVSQMRVEVPQAWAPVRLSWNGIDLVKEAAGGCWMLSMEKDPPHATPCQ